jgi:glycosyltransferase involved in cell wall biosynthesis
MNPAPKISVVIATYNRARLLPQTIESVLKQTFQDFETIVVDDGSTDNTVEIVRAYGDRVKYVQQTNRGPSAARNFGAQVARGSWIAFQDSDDLCASNYLESLYKFASSHSNCGMIFANGAYLHGKEHGRETIIPTGLSRRLAKKGVRLVDLFDKSIVRLQAALISRACYDAVGGHNETLRIAMDLDLAFRIFMVSPVAYLDEVVFHYRKHEGNTGRDQELRLRENIRVIEKLIGNFPDAVTILGHGRVARRLAYRYYRLAKWRWKDGRRTEAKEALRHALVLRPLAFKYRYFGLRWLLADKWARQYEL